MARDLQRTTTAGLLAFLTLTVGIFAWLNFQQERQVSSPDDGIWWVETDGHLRAERIHPGGPGERAGIKPGDYLIEANGQPITNTATLTRQLYRKGIYSEAKYLLLRNGVTLETPVVLVPADRSLNL